MDDLSLEEQRVVHALVCHCLNLSPEAAIAFLDQQLKGRTAEFRAAASQLYRASSARSAPPQADALPDRTAEYEVIRPLGSGGTSDVFLARQRHLNRFVALKVLRSDAFTTSQDALQRFSREVAAAAKLDHPNIVAVYETGLFQGRPSIAYRFVDGPTLGKTCGIQPMTPDDAARCVMAIANGIAHAHQRQVIHRDLKPANVMLDQGRPVIADFGLAMLPEESAEITRTGELLGTPAWMSPEQTRGDRSQIDSRSDVYSLGNLLYFTLTARAPFDSATTTRLLHDIQSLPPPRLPRTVPRDLSTICETCLMKSPKDRYASAELVAEELHRYLERKPIKARKITRLKRMQLWAQRERGMALALLLFAMLIAVVTIGTTGAAIFYAEKATTETGLRLQETDQRKQAEHQRLRADSLREQSRARELNVRTVSLDVQDDLNADLGNEPFEIRLLSRQFPPQVEYSRVLEDHHWALVDALFDPSTQRAVSLDEGRRLLVWDVESNRVMKVLDAGTPDRLGVESRHVFKEWIDQPQAKWPHAWSDLDWSPDRQRVIAASLNGRVAEFSVSDGTQRDLFNLSNESWHALAVDPRTGHLLVGSANGTLLLRRGEKDQLQVEDPVAVSSLACLPDLNAWVVGRADGQVEVRDAQTLKLLQSINLPGPIWSLDTKITPTNSGMIAVGANSLTAQVYELSPRRDRLQWRASLQRPGTQNATGSVSCVRFMLEGNGLLIGDSEWRVSRWDWAAQRIEYVLPKLAKDDRRPELVKMLKVARPDVADRIPLAFRRSVVQLAESSDGRIAVAGEDGVLKWCRVGASQNPFRRRWQVTGFERPQVAFHLQDADTLWLMSETGKLGTVSISREVVTREIQAHNGTRAGIAVLKDRSVLTVGHDTEVRRWKIRNDQIEPVGGAIFKHSVPIVSVAVSPDDALVAIVDDESRVCLFERLTGKSLLLVPIPGAERKAPLTGKVVFSPDGKRLAASGAGQAVCVIDVDNLRIENSSLTVAGGGATALAWCGLQSALLFAADDAKRYAHQLFDDLPRYRASIHPPLEVKQNCVAMARTTDGRRIACLEVGGSVNFIETNWLLEVHRQQADVGSEAVDIAFDQLGNRCVVTGRDGEISLWDVSQPEQQPAEPIEVTVTSEAWVATEVIPPTDHMQYVSLKAVSQHEGRLAIAAVIGIPESRHNLGHGQLHVLTETETSWERETIVVDGTQRDFASQPDSVAIQRLPQDQLRIVFRRNLGPNGPYDGDFVFGERGLDRRWRFETITQQKNDGHYPTLITNSDGSLQSVVHYSFATRELLLSTPPDRPGAAWRTINLTGPGLGLRSQGWLGAGNKSYFFSQRHRMNGDPSWPRLFEVQSESMTRIEVPADCELIGPIRRHDNGQPVIMAKHYSDNARRSDLVFMERTEAEWNQLASMPFTPRYFGWHVTKTDCIVVMLRSANDPQLTMATWGGKHWQHEVIYRRPDNEQFGFNVFQVDEQDHLSIVLQNSIPSSSRNRHHLLLLRRRKIP